MNFRLLFISLLMLPFVSFSQMINETELHNFKVAFNETYIKNNHIKCVTGYSSYKKSLRPIVEKGTFNQYSFDLSGKLIELTETFKVSQQRKDSSTTKYIYDKDILGEKITTNAQGEHTYLYTINSDNKAEKLSYTRGGLNEQKTLVFEEFYTYETPTDTSEVKWFLNRYGKPYQKETSSYNEHEYLLSVEKKLVFGGKTSRTSYVYDDFGRLTEKIERKNNDTLKTKYVYDEYANLIESDHYKNDKLARHEEFIYDSKTALIKAHLSKEISSGTITITKFTVAFY